jgi:hypothetical protein
MYSVKFLALFQNRFSFTQDAVIEEDFLERLKTSHPAHRRLYPDPLLLFLFIQI